MQCTASLSRLVKESLTGYVRCLWAGYGVCKCSKDDVGVQVTGTSGLTLQAVGSSSLGI
jgi:hypothetical protein